MAVISNTVKKQKNKINLITLCAILLTGIFVAVFFSTNNIKVSFDAFSGSDQYRIDALTSKRQGVITARIKGLTQNANLSAQSGLKADIAFDTSSKKVNVAVRDKNDRPVSRITVIGNVTRVGKKHISRQFKMRNYGNGTFSSIPLDLADGGWVLTVSAYDLYSNNRDKLLFYTERAIYLENK